MKIEDYESPAIADKYAPRAKASQIAAGRHRDRITEPLTPITTVRNPKPANYLPIAIGAVVLVLAMVGMITWQLRRPLQPLAIQAAPTAASTSTPTAAPTNTPTVAPTSTPAPTAAPPEQLPEQPVGRGLTVISDERPPEQPAAAPSTDYIANVGAQAPHSPRGGLCGATSGDCAPGVPESVDSSQYIANVGAQAPHGVR